jgi:cytochrome b involved in lipid metabolism
MSHPGGDGAIKFAMGKDISEVFDSIGHSQYASKILEEFYVGDLRGSK